MKTAVAPHSHRALPDADAQAAAFARLTQKERDTFDRQITNATTRGGEALAALWRRLAGVGLALCTRPAKVSGMNTIQFFIADGNYRKQVYAMHLSDEGEVTVFLPNILAEAIKAKIIAPLPKDPTPHAYAVGKERMIIEPYDRDSLNPQPYYKDMTGWNRKAIGVVLPAGATEGLIDTAEQLMLAAATWPAVAPDPVR